METNELKELWVEKYRPQNLEDYVLNEDLKKYFRDMMTSRSLQSMCFAGCCGSGKTTLAKVICNELGAETLFVPCATEGTIDILRTKIQDFCNALTIDGKPKVVILDEIDSASSNAGSSFQMGLRTLIEAAQSDTRFILTCNYATKVIDAVLSRCPIVPLKFDKKDLLQRVKYILDNEHVSYTKDSLKAFIEEAFGFYPDIRKIVNYLQFCSSSGSLVVQMNKIVNSDKDNLLKDIVNAAQSSTSLLDVRRLYLSQKEKISDFIAFGSDLFNYAVDNDLVTDAGVLKLADLVYQLNVVIDKEVGVFGIVTALRAFSKTRS